MAKGFLLNFINVGVLGFWLGIIITIGPQLDMNPQKLLEFFIFVITAYIATDISKILLAKQLKNKLTSKNILKIKKISCVVLIIFGFVIMSKSVIKDEPKFIKDTLERTHS